MPATSACVYGKPVFRGDGFDADYWLTVASLMMTMMEVCRSGQAVLIKTDGLRRSDSTYTVLLDGPPDEGPLFRQDSGDLRAAMTEALERCAPFIKSSTENLHSFEEIAIVLAELDCAVRSDAFIAIRFDYGNPASPIGVSIGGPSMGREFLARQGADILSLLREAIGFYRDQAEGAR